MESKYYVNNHGTAAFIRPFGETDKYEVSVFSRLGEHIGGGIYKTLKGAKIALRNMTFGSMKEIDGYSYRVLSAFWGYEESDFSEWEEELSTPTFKRFRLGDWLADVEVKAADNAEYGTEYDFFISCPGLGFYDKDFSDGMFTEQPYATDGKTHLTEEEVFDIYFCGYNIARDMRIYLLEHVDKYIIGE